MGRLKFLVKDFRSDKVSANIDLKNESSPIKRSARCEDIDDFAEEEEVEIECGIADKSESIQCKICWSDEQSSENPLLSSCKCDGSVRYIHFNCLKYWLK
jgi:hypothetical protein